MNKACQFCLKEFQPSGYNEVYCSNDCRKKAKKEMNYGYPSKNKFSKRYQKSLSILKNKHKKQFKNIMLGLKELEGGNKDGKKEKTS